MSTIVKNIPIVFSCNICNKTYKDSSGLWKHNKNKHTINSQSLTQKSLINSDDLSCTYCDKIYSRNDSLKRHLLHCREKTKKEHEEKIYLQQIEILTKKIESIERKTVTKTKNSIIINNNNCNNDNRKLIICNPGDENISQLTDYEKKYIKSQGLNSIITLVDQLNFNERLPQNHNFYVSAINDKHVNTIDPKTNSVTKKFKKELFDQILCSHMNKLESIGSSDKRFLLIFDKLKEFIYLKNGRKEFVTQINMLSYNKRNMVIKSWEQLVADDNLSPEATAIKFEEEVKQITELEDDSDESSSDDDSSSDYQLYTPSFKKLLQ